MSNLTQHLTELRRRLIFSLVVLAVLFISLLQFANSLYYMLATPLLHLLPANSQLIATEVTAPLLTPMKLAFYVSMALFAPLGLYQIWAFIVPALYPQERKLLKPLVLLSILLFFVGAAFAYITVLPLIFNFMVQTTPKGVAMMTDMNAYLDFVINLLFAFGIAFQCPVIICLLIRFNIVSLETFQEKRQYILVLAFAVGMVLTPPDVISQTLLAVPLYFLFELGLLLSKLQKKQPTSSIS